GVPIQISRPTMNRGVVPSASIAECQQGPTTISSPAPSTSLSFPRVRSQKPRNHPEFALMLQGSIVLPSTRSSTPPYLHFFASIYSVLKRLNHHFTNFRWGRVQSRPAGPDPVVVRETAIIQAGSRSARPGRRLPARGR